MHSLADSRAVVSCAKIYWPGVVMVKKSSLPSRKLWVTYVAQTIGLLEQRFQRKTYTGSPGEGTTHLCFEQLCDQL